MNLRELFGKKQRVCDMAYEQREYIALCAAMSDKLFVNLAKICTFDNYGLQKHWGAEASNSLMPLMRRKLDNDNKKTQPQKRELIIKHIITGVFGENYEEYDYESLKEDYVEAIESEGYSFDDFDVESIVNRNKQCYINYFEKLKKVPFDDYKPYLWNMSNEFINDVRAAYANE